jgi:hypothetical protein
MDSKTLLLTANADVIYYISFLDLTKGPMVVETPPGALGTIDDMWFLWVVDFGLPGADRGTGARPPLESREPDAVQSHGAEVAAPDVEADHGFAIAVGRVGVELARAVPRAVAAAYLFTG